MQAILSDIHGNLEALTAVLADIALFDVKRIICLGDTVGYGPNPIECLEIVRERCGLALCGEQDRAIFMDDFSGWTPHAAVGAIRLAQARLRLPEQAELLRYLDGLQPSQHEGSRLYVHGSARDPLTDYLFPEDVYNPRKLERIFDLILHVCFCGHTHVPGVITDSGWRFDPKTARRERVGDGVHEWHQPEGDDWAFTLDERLAVVNVGSVGQPRDGDPRAGYVLADGVHLRFRRVPYDVDATVRKIHAIPDLEDFLGDRLREGR